MSERKFDEYCESRTSYFKSKITALEFFKELKPILGLKKTYQLFPYFITCIPNNETAKELDDSYYS